MMEDLIADSHPFTFVIRCL